MDGIWSTVYGLQLQVEDHQSGFRVQGLGFRV